MAMDDELDDEGTQASGGGINPELVKSYLAFAARAIRQHRLAVVAVFLVGAGLTVAGAVFWPRTYVCKTVLMAQVSTLDRNDAPSPLAQADTLIVRHQNLEAIIRDIGLARSFEIRRPPLLRLKDQVIAALFGPTSEKDRIGSLVGTLESKIETTTDNNQLAITVSWSDAQTAAELAGAARESFLRSRHTAEMSAFEDKMSILDGHASKLREDVTDLANQMESESQGGATQTSPGAPAPHHPTGVRVAASKGPDPLVTEQLSTLRQKLAEDKTKLNGLEAEWQRRVSDAQAKLDDLRLRLTPSHPEVVTQQQRVSMVSQVPSEVAALRAEVATLSGDVKAGDLVVSRGSAAPGAIAAANADTLPSEVIQALAKDDADPALRAQLSGAIVKYGDLRNEILSGRIDLDTAQAAFNHRYQIVVPAEAPSKPTKPKPALILGVGLFLSLLLALALPILAELRKGVIVDTWQMETLQLPLLAELRLPPHSD